MLVCSSLLFYLLVEILPRLVPRETLQTLLLIELTHHLDLRLSVVGVAVIEVSHPLLKTWLVTVDVGDLPGDRRIAKHPKVHA